MTEHQLFLFLAETAALVAAARIGGEIALRLGIAQVVGELVMGIALGPSLFGALWPGGFHALFPTDPGQRNLLEIMGWIGVIFLALLSGMETRLGMVRRAGRAVAYGWMGGFLLPFAAGFGLAFLTPGRLLPRGIDQAVFALFVGTAMSISAIPVIARILMDMGLMRTRIGTVIISSAVADDTVGWIVLAVVTGLVLRRRFDLSSVAVAVLGTAAFLIVAFTLGQWLVARALAWSERMRAPHAFTAMKLVIVFLGGAATQAIHVHLVLGVFVAGILIYRSPTRNRAAAEEIRAVAMALFVPFFFAYTGIKVDLTTITGSALAFAAAAVAVACGGKLIGGSLGARAGGLPMWGALAVGAGLNARGAMELVIATIGLSIGVLTLPVYSILVLIAVLTTLMAAPLLRVCVARVPDAGADVARKGTAAEIPV